MGEVRAKKPSLTLNLGINGVEVTSEPPPMNDQAGELLARTGSLSGHPSKQQPRSTLLDPILVHDLLMDRYILLYRQSLPTQQLQNGEWAAATTSGSSMMP
ncbi:hypothetical protein J6590_078628 [Homalodisca vitripennis]|nr:hypothetical protein J6590_078628 [Homalodisca vitripennis]